MKALDKATLGRRHFLRAVGVGAAATAAAPLATAAKADSETKGREAQVPLPGKRSREKLLPRQPLPELSAGSRPWTRRWPSTT